MLPVVILFIFLFSISLLQTTFLLFQWKNSSSVEISYLLPEGIRCDFLFEGNHSHANEAALWKFYEEPILREIEKAKNRCEKLKSVFGFYEKALSEEERDFPLAFGMLVHNDIIQIYLLLSAIYQPQNEFCIAVDGQSPQEFYNSVLLLQECFPNIRVFRAKSISWCGFSILEAVMDCVQYLSSLNRKWRYFQYLSGVDSPLKTNLEMVRILKALNGSVNAEILPFEFYRLHHKKLHNSPLPLFKTSLSAVLPRETVDFLANSPIVRQQIEFLNDTECADESLWVTVLGNPTNLSAPGAFDALDFLNRNYPYYRKSRRKTRFAVDSYYISRYQQWMNRPPSKCKGTFFRLSCVFGVDDLPLLINRPELVAHKFYMTFQPAAFFCLIKEIRRRSLHPLEDFTAEEYQNLPGAPRRIH